MNKIGIIVAMEEEQEEILNIMSNIEEKDIYEVTVKTGRIGKNKVVVAKCGVGKVNAARVTQICRSTKSIIKHRGYSNWRKISTT